MIGNYEYDEEDTGQVIATVIRKSARDRKCELCSETINKGASYQRVIVKFEGSVSAISRHIGGICEWAVGY